MNQPVMGEPPTPPPPEGPPPPARPPGPQVSPAFAAFGAAIRALTPRGFVMETLVAINVLVFVVMVVRGVSPMEPTIADLLAWGAGYGPRTTSGEWWRLLTATFLHIGALHLGMNMYCLWSAGRLVERIFGNVGFLVLYLSAGLAGSVASVAWNPFIVSAGASGAVFGVYGGMLGFALRERRSIPPEALQSLQRSGLFFVGVNLMIGVRMTGIDMAAHVGGLVGGFVGGLVLAHPLDRAGASKRWLRNLVLAAGAAVFVTIATQVLPRNVDIDAETDRFNAIVGDFNAMIRRAKSTPIGDDEFATEIETKILPPWRATRGRLEAAKRLPAPQAAHVASVLAFATAREESFRLLAEYARTHDPATLEQQKAKQQEGDRLLHALSGAK